MCEDCTASEGGCKHAVAFLAWVHRRSETPSTTEVECHWKKSLLSTVGTSRKFIKASEMGKSGVAEEQVDNTFLQHVVEYSKEISRMDTVLTKYFKDFSTMQRLSLHYLLCTYKTTCSATNAEDFKIFYCQHMIQQSCEEACKETEGQADDALWHELRYARITASKAYNVFHSKTVKGSVVESILGASELKDMPAIKRGRTLEKEVLQVLAQKINTKLVKCGLMLHKEHPFVGASPDALSENCIIEIKCPSSVTNLTKNITKENKVTARYLMQVQLQMHFFNKPKAFFCVAYPDFEETKNINIVSVDYDKEYCNDKIQKMTAFWKDIIFPILMK